MKKVSIFKHFNEVVEDMEITAVLDKIRQQPQNPTFFTNLREAYKEGRQEEFEKAKKGLSAFTPSGTFKGGRKSEYLESYSGLLILDFDKLGDELAEVKAVVKADNHTYASFLSPSGNGLKVLVKVATTQDEHAAIFNVAAEYYSALTGINVDPSGKDVTRLCFMSYDPELYNNPDSEPFELSTLVISTDFEATFRRGVELTNKLVKFEEGQRNNFVFRLACNCKRLGIPEGAALPLVMAKYGYDEKEVTASVKSAYTNNPDEYAKFANSTNQAAADESTTENDELAGTPLIPDEAYESLPTVLKAGASVFSNKRQRDVFLTGALSVVGGSMENVSGIYQQEVTFPNLYSFIIAAAASGKGALRYSKVLGDEIHRKLRSQKDKPGKVLFIPGNSSASAVIKHLNESEGKGVMFETEADTLNNAIKQEWGNFSDMMRKAFHHETISSSRTTKDEFIEVLQPRLSIALSGTPGQVEGLIQSAEDGLFSRFIYYAFQGELEWKDGRPSEEVNYSQHFAALSVKVGEVVQFLSEHPTKFDLTPQQWDRHTIFFTDKLKQLPQFIGSGMESVVKRMGNITYRIAMILSVMAKAEAGIESETLICSDAHFDAALKIAATYLSHSVIVFKRMPKTDKVDARKRKFYDALPTEEFTRAKAVQIGAELGLAKDRAIDNYLKELVAGKLLTNENYGKYKKV